MSEGRTGGHPWSNMQETITTTIKPRKGGNKSKKVVENIKIKPIKNKNKQPRNKNKKNSKQACRNQYERELNSVVMGQYAQSLLRPELLSQARIPLTIHNTPPCMLNRHLSFIIPSNANGAVAIGFLPEALLNTTNSFSSLAYTVGLTYDGTTNPVSIVYQTMNHSIASTDFTQYRLVSASAHCYSTQPNLTRSGKVIGGIGIVNPTVMTATNSKGFYVQTPGAKALDMLPNDYAVQSNLLNSFQAVTAQLSNGEHARITWRPDSPECFQYDGVDHLDEIAYGSTSTAGANMTYFAFIVTGMAASSNINVDIFANFEYIPDSTSINVNTGRYSTENVLPEQVISHINRFNTFTSVSNQLEHRMLGRGAGGTITSRGQELLSKPSKNEDLISLMKKNKFEYDIGPTEINSRRDYDVIAQDINDDAFSEFIDEKEKKKIGEFLPRKDPSIKKMIDINHQQIGYQKPIENVNPQKVIKVYPNNNQ